MTRDRYLSDDELRRFMEAVRTRRHINQPRDHAFFAILANTGIRPSEALALSREDVHVHCATPWLMLKRDAGPARPVVELVIHDDVAVVIRKWCAGMSRKSKLFPFTRRQSERLFHYYLERAKVQRFKIYSLRHTVGMKLWRHTRDLRLMQAIMGHARMRATEIYSQVPAKDVAAALEAIGV